MNKEWSVYVMLSDKDNWTYVGISTDVNRRLAQHNGQLPGGAKFTRAHRPWNIVAVYGGLSKGDAMRLEALIKRRRGLRRFDPI